MPQKKACEPNSPITEQEKKQSINHLKNNKNSIVKEMFKVAGNCYSLYATFV